MPLLDARDPFVLDTRELGRRPGSMRAVRRTVAAPSGFGLNLTAVPVGSPIELDLRLEAVMEGVLVSGRAAATVHGECARCLDPVSFPVEAELCELYAYPGHESDDEDIGRLEGDLINFEPQLRDAIVLALPLRPVCDDECAGLCATCGVRLADEPAEHSHDEADPRWAALRLVRLDPEKSER
ncbi:MAG: YceD family protein [Actinomycetes bacterium]